MPTQTRSRELIELLEQERLSTHEQLLAENASARVMMEQLEEQVAKRVEAMRAEIEAFDEIARLATELRRAGVEQSMLTSTIKRLDRTDRKVKSISRQALNVMIAQREQRQRRGAAAGGVNMAAFQ